jgi:acyl-CoA thioester hydrolase
MSGGVHRHPVRVYWEDTDAGGVVYHASHVRFFERGRTEWLRALGVMQSRSADRAAPDALFFVVRRMEVDYLRPARLDDLLDVETRVETLAPPRLVLAQRLLRDADVVAEALVTVVAVGGNGRPRRLPPDLAARLGATD